MLVMTLGIFLLRVEVRPQVIYHYLKSGNHVYLGGLFQVSEKSKTLPRSNSVDRGFLRMSAKEWS